MSEIHREQAHIWVKLAILVLLATAVAVFILVAALGAVGWLLSLVVVAGATLYLAQNLFWRIDQLIQARIEMAGHP